MPDTKIKRLANSILLVFLSLFLLSNSGGEDNLVVKIKAYERKFPTALMVTISLVNSSKLEVKIPKKQSVVIGYKDDDDADCFFEVMEVSGSSDIAITPTADYQYVNTKMKNKYFSLKRGASVNYTFNLTNFYRFDQSKKYKIRFVFKFSKNNELVNGYSDWLNVN